MDAITLLKKDHRQVVELFARYQSARARSAKKRIAGTVFSELEVHSAIEKEIFYPALCEVPGNRGKDMVAAGLEEHQWIEELIGELKGGNPGEEQYDASFSVLIENIQHHVREEERDMFPYAQNTLGSELADLGARMEARKRELAKGASVTGVIRGFVTKAFETLAGNGSGPARRRRRVKPKRRGAPARIARGKSASGARQKTPRRVIAGKEIGML